MWDVASVLFVFGWEEQKIPLHWLKLVRSLFGPHPRKARGKQSWPEGQFTGVFHGSVSFHLLPLHLQCGLCQGVMWLLLLQVSHPRSKQEGVARLSLFRGKGNPPQRFLPLTHWLEMCDMEEKGKEAWGTEEGPCLQFPSLCDYEYCWASSGSA